MKRIDEFESRLDGLIEEFADLSYEEIADSLDYYASNFYSKSNREKRDE